MSSFIRIGDTIINTNYIHHIKISTDSYMIHMAGCEDKKGLIMFGSGHLRTENFNVLVSKSQYKEGYDRVSKWILDNNLGW
jgi:hypothetical protein